MSTIKEQELMDEKLFDLEDKWISEITPIVEAIKNRNRRKILRLCHKDEKNISEISRVLKCNKKAIYEHVKILESVGLVNIRSAKKEKHKPSYITSNYQYFIDILGVLPHIREPSECSII